MGAGGPYSLYMCVCVCRVSLVVDNSFFTLYCLNDRSAFSNILSYCAVFTGLPLLDEYLYFLAVSSDRMAIFVVNRTLPPTISVPLRIHLS